MSSDRSLGQIANYKPLARLNMEELAARQKTIIPSGGVLFSRNVDGDEKSAARQKVLDLFHPTVWPQPIHVLSLPGVHWRFERKMLGMREIGWMSHKEYPKRTLFTGVENDRAIYYASVGQMPGLHTPNSMLKRTKQFPFSELGVKTHYASVFFANIDDLMMFDWQSKWDAAWLDYTGPLSTERLEIIKRFYARHISSTLIVTALKARWNEKTSNAVRRAGGHSEWLRENLPGEVLHDIEYNDTSPMAQFAVRHVRWKSPLV